MKNSTEIWHDGMHDACGTAFPAFGQLQRKARARFHLCRRGKQRSVPSRPRRPTALRYIVASHVRHGKKGRTIRSTPSALHRAGLKLPDTLRVVRESAACIVVSDNLSRSVAPSHTDLFVDISPSTLRADVVPTHLRGRTGASSRAEVLLSHRENLTISIIAKVQYPKI